jgi:hypothetical protein
MSLPSSRPSKAETPFAKSRCLLPASSGAASLLASADRQSLRLMIVGGEGWTFVMHPLMGVATLDEDPARHASRWRSFGTNRLKPY